MQTPSRAAFSDRDRALEKKLLRAHVVIALQRSGRDFAGYQRRTCSWRSRVCAYLSLFLLGQVGLSAVAPANEASTLRDLLLDSGWEAGLDRGQLKNVQVPGLAAPANEISPSTLWYRRTVELPAGNWNVVTLTLAGARFAPKIYVDGDLVASSEGGMAPVRVSLRHPHVSPGNKIILEIALTSLRDLDPLDASAVPIADRWRTNVSSGLWDNVALHFSSEVQVARIIPWTDFQGDNVAVHWVLGTKPPPGITLQATIADLNGAIVAKSAEAAIASDTGVSAITLHGACLPWSPETPRLFRLAVIVSKNGRELERSQIPWGFRDFRTNGLRFSLNNKPVQLRGGTVVWHRWIRDPQAQAVAGDVAWFQRNIVQRLKDEGANFLRFHLGLPPEALLDLCDREGLLVQIEWPFFHGISASPASMAAQWRDWLDVAMHHPSAVLIHPWNETGGAELQAGWTAIDSILLEYPPLVIAHRDAIPVHKYWWSMFENLGLYYDSVEPFGRPVTVDEFGGNYLDYEGNPGSYPTVRESFLRFLGRDATAERRLLFQAEANARVGEYWRRLGAAGIAPFCAMGSREDGNTWFLGSLEHPQPKPVWDALTALFSPQSVSLELWDRNFAPDQLLNVPLYFFNERDTARELHAKVRLVTNDAASRLIFETSVSQTVPAHESRVAHPTLRMPNKVGEWRVEAELVDAVEGVSRPIVSAWSIRTLQVDVPQKLRDAEIGVPDNEPELAVFLAQNNVRVVKEDSPAARAIVLSTASWQRVVESSEFRNTLETAVKRGQSILFLDVGPRDLGAGYKPFDPTQLEGAPVVGKARIETRALFFGITVTFREAAEPESHLHPALSDASLWNSLPREATWLWNGLRGGLILPADDMNVNGLAPSALTSLWIGRGANEAALHGGHYYAYQLADYYAFSDQSRDATVIAQLRAKVKQLAEDAPALQNRINPTAPVEIVDLGQLFQPDRLRGKATALVPLASCGKNLSRTPIVELRFGPGEGTVILSQALTAGRLRRGQSEPGLYGIRHDPAAEQFALNLIARAIEAAAAGK